MLVTASSVTSFTHSLELHTMHSQHPQSLPTPSSWKASSPFQSPLLINEREINRYTSNTHPEPCHAITIQCSLSVCHHFGVGSSTANIIILQSSLLLCRRRCSYGLEWSDEDTFSIMRSPLTPHQLRLANLMDIPEHIKKAPTRIGRFLHSILILSSF